MHRKLERAVDSYDSLGSAVKRVPVVSPELGVGTVERRVPLGLGLLDAVVISLLASSFSMRCCIGGWRCVPVPVRLARLVVLGRVLGLCNIVSISIKETSG